MSLVDLVRDAGIIGCGGAGFPAHVKIDAVVDVVIANGAECEPLLNTDQRVMEHYAAELVDGLVLIMKHMGAGTGYIAIKKGYSGAVEALKERVKKISTVDLRLLNNYYPAGDEQILLTDLTGKIVPEGGIPLNVNAVVGNVLTMVQVSRAAKKKTPVTERAVTLVGEIFKPQVVTVPIGTTVSYLLDFVIPLVPAEGITVIDGGPMMGNIVDLDDSINKTTSGLIFLSSEHPLIKQKSLPVNAMIRRSVAACCQCRLCTDVCSRWMQGHNIEPHLMMRSLAYKTDSGNRATTAAFLCSQCGLCEFACPMDLSPKRVYAEMLKKFRVAGLKNPHNNIPAEVHEFREYRKISKDRLTRRYGLLKYESHNLVLSQIPEPPMVRLSLKQQIGAPSEPVVRKGQSVKKGALVARIPEGKLGANHHASINGRITEITDDYITIEGG